MKFISLLFNLKLLYNFFLFLALINIFFSTGKSHAKTFSINDIEISTPFEINFNKNEIIDEGFVKAFNELILSIVQSKDQVKLKNTSINQIKGMIETFSIKEEKFIDEIYYLTLNVSFNKKNIFDLLETKNIFPSLPVKKDFLFIPVFVDQNKNQVSMFSENILFTNWNLNNKKYSLLNYILPTQDLDDFNLIKKNINNLEDFNFKANQVASRELDRKFGRPEDYAEIHVLSTTDQLLNSDFNFTNYTTPPESIDTDGLISEINMDPVNELNNLGYTSGKYKIKLNLLRRKILNSPISIFSIKEISSSRRELRLKLNAAFNNTETIASIRNFINEVESNIFFKDFGLNFMQGEVITAINIALDERGRQPELLIKLLDPLSINYNTDSECSIVEEIIDPTVLTINLGRPEDIDDSIPLQGPNFKIDTRLNSSIPSTFKTYDEILNKDNTIDIIIKFKDIEKQFVERINIKGNFITDEKVIRNNLIIDEGDPYNDILFNKSIQTIKAMNIFKNVDYKSSENNHLIQFLKSADEALMYLDSNAQLDFETQEEILEEADYDYEKIFPDNNGEISQNDWDTIKWKEDKLLNQIYDSLISNIDESITTYKNTVQTPSVTVE